MGGRASKAAEPIASAAARAVKPRYPAAAVSAADTSAAEGAVAAAAGEQAAAHVVDATTLPTVELEPSLLQRQNEWVPEVKTRKEKVEKPKEKQAALERFYEQQRKDAQLGVPLNRRRLPQNRALYTPYQMRPEQQPGRLSELQFRAIVADRSPKDLKASIFEGTKSVEDIEKDVQQLSKETGVDAEVLKDMLNYVRLPMLVKVVEDIKIAM